MAQDAQLVLLAQYAHDALSSAIGVAEETYSSAHSVLTLAQGDVNHLFRLLHPFITSEFWQTLMLSISLALK